MILPGVHAGQHPGGDTLAHRLPVHKQVVVPVHGGPFVLPVPGADGEGLLPPQGAAELIPHPGEHPEGVVAVCGHVPAEAPVLGGLGGRLLDVAQQGGGLAVAVPIHVPGVDGQGHLVKEAHLDSFPRSSSVVLQQMSSRSSAVAAGMRIWAPRPRSPGTAGPPSCSSPERSSSWSRRCRRCRPGRRCPGSQTKPPP